MGVLEAAHDELVRARGQLEPVLLVPPLGDVAAKLVAGIAAGWLESANGSGITPKNIAHGSVVGWLPEAIDLLDVVDGLDFGAETAMDT